MLKDLVEHAMRRARQIGRITAGRLFGTIPNTSGKYIAIMDLEERAIYCRAEMNAVAALLIKKGLITSEEFQAQLAEELNHLADSYQAKIPEVLFTPIGMTVTDVKAFAERAKREGWPP